jgi:hypothetical protein
LTASCAVSAPSAIDGLHRSGHGDILRPRLTTQDGPQAHLR